MLGVLGLLTGWLLMLPLLVFIWVRITHSMMGWMVPFGHMATSFPILALSTTAGLTLIVLSVRKLIGASERDPGPY